MCGFAIISSIQTYVFCYVMRYVIIIPYVLFSCMSICYLELQSTASSILISYIYF